MASKRSKRVASCLPGEIISEILLLLPARSVLRFRAVCRQWAAQLSSPGFMGAYAARAGTRRVSNPKLVIFAAPPGRRATAAYSCSSSSSSSSAADTLFTADHLRPDFLSLSSRPCRGLVLLSDARAAGSYWVCNPSTGERRPLPLPPRHRGLLVLSSAGLGVDDRTMECKVVHLFSTAGSACGPRCEVYTLGGRWRPVAATALEWLYDNAMDVTRALQTEAAVTRTPPVHAGGSLHWLVYPTSDDMAAPVGRDRGGGAIVLRFSVSDESFGFVDVPASLPMEDYVSLEEHSPAVPVHLAELRGSLCMVHDLRRRPRGSLDVWVLGGCNNNAGGWSLEYRIPVTPPMARDVHGPRFITVLGACIAGEQEKLLVGTSEHKVFAYATGTGRVEAVLSVGGETTGIGLQREATAGVRLGLYEDSLVRISRHKEQVMSASVAEILLRLPLKSIAQSMLVCREWRALIESESFVTRHAMIGKSTKTLLMVTNGRARRAFFAFTPLDRWLLDQAAASPAGLAGGGRVVCSKPCHGLNLISTGSDDYLCNPCTGDIKCLGIRGKSRFGPRCQPAAGGRHAFTVGRKVGFGLDRSTGEHVAVEIGHDLCGAPACVLKTSESDYWTCAGTPPVPVTDMPPAHVDGTLYWTAEQAPAASSNHRRRLVIVAFDISARTFGSFQCDDQPCPDPAGAFLVELNSTLSLVTTNRQAEEMAIWVMRGAAWVEAHRVCLRGQPGFSPRATTVVVPLEIIGGGSGDGCRILLSTGRALGYYDTTTGALDTVYSLDHLRPAAPDEFAVPMLCQESLVRVPDDDELPVDRVAPPPNHPAGADGEQGMTPRPIFHQCQNAGCRGRGDVYSACCKRLICVECLRRCPEHHRGQHFPLSTVFDYGVVEGIQRHGLPVEHPFVPDPDRYGYYYSAVDGGHVVRHVFISLRDFVRHNQPCHLTECAYRMDGRVGPALSLPEQRISPSSAPRARAPAAPRAPASSSPRSPPTRSLPRPRRRHAGPIQEDADELALRPPREGLLQEQPPGVPRRGPDDPAPGRAPRRLRRRRHQEPPRPRRVRRPRRLLGQRRAAAQAGATPPRPHAPLPRAARRRSGACTSLVSCFVYGQVVIVVACALCWCRHLKGEDLNSLQPRELFAIEEALQNGQTNLRDKQVYQHQQDVELSGGMRELDIGYHQHQVQQDSRNRCQCRSFANCQ